MTETQPSRQGIKLFRGKDAPSLAESGVVYRGEGDDGMSLVRAWFGPHYVLPRHTHDGDCLYSADEYGDDWAERRARVAG